MNIMKSRDNDVSIIDLEDLRFCLFDQLGVQGLFYHEPYAHLDADQLQEVLVRAEEMATGLIAPLNRVAAEQPPRFTDGKVMMPPPFRSAFQKYREAGWIPITLGKEAGGLGIPESAGMAVREIFNSACGPFFAFSSLTYGALNLIQSLGSPVLKRLFLEKMRRGLYTGTMCLTEPHAGSYLAEIKTVATRADGCFKIKGTKVFIGTGEHDLSENIVHCVLARLEGSAEGYKGLSLFVVPKYRVSEDGGLGPPNDVVCGGIEEKMGWEAAPTVVLHFGQNDQCHGWLLGEEGRGLHHMFLMMNEMRLATAAQGVGQASAAYRIALAFAKKRIQGLSCRRRKGDSALQVPIIEHPDIRRNLMFMKAAVEGCRRLLIQTGLFMDLARVHRGLKDGEYYQDLVEILTPICKAYATEMGFRVAETALQTMGGYGYLKGSGVEQRLRDLKVASIYEGTNGIQAIDLQKRKLNIKGGRLFRNMLHQIDGFIKEHLCHPSLGGLTSELASRRRKIEDVARAFRGKADDDPCLLFSVAKPFLDMAGHLLCTWMLLKSAAVAASLLGKRPLPEEKRIFLEGKLLTARFAVSNLLPLVDALATTISSWDRSLLEIDDEAL